MRLHEVSHGGKSEIVGRQIARIHSSAEALLLKAPMYPAVGDAVTIRRLVIVEQAFGRVEQVPFFQTQIAHVLQHVFETAVRGLVGPYILSGVDRVKLNVEFLIAARECAVVDIR